MRTGTTEDKLPKKIVAELAAIGLTRATDVLTIADGQVMIKPPEQMGRSHAAAIAGVEKTSAGWKIKFYDKLKALAKEVYIEREPHEQCRSAKPGVKMNKLLQEIIDVEAYKKDYEYITMKMLFEEIDYETAVIKLQQVVTYGLFE